MRKPGRIAVWSGIIAAVFMGSCRKKERFDPALYQEVAADNARVTGEQNYLTDAVDNQGEEGSLRRETQSDSTFLPRCANVTYNSQQRRLIIDFGATNCLCRDGVYRRGKVIVDFSGPSWREAGARAYITTDNYFVNDNQHIVEKVLFHEGVNASGERVIRDTVRLHRVITPDGTLEWRAERTYRQTAGQNTWRRWDDIWLIEDNGQGTTRRGRPFTTQTQEALKVLGSCSFRVPVRGVWQISTDERTVRVNFDPYGNEACDRVVSVQVNDRPAVNVTL
ncbi:MAG: hypothetical protein ABDH91_06365 [Bacteroidia bacterium]